MESCGVTIKLFADDAKIYAAIIDIRDVEKLQRALDLLLSGLSRGSSKLL